MQKNRPKGGFSRKGGPSDRIRTCGILLPKQARYQLRYTPIEFFFSALVLSARLAVPEKAFVLRILVFFDRCAYSALLHPPLAALGFVPQSAGATNCATPRFYSNLALLEWMGSPNSIMDFLPKVNGDRCISRKKDL